MCLDFRMKRKAIPIIVACFLSVAVVAPLAVMPGCSSSADPVTQNGVAYIQAEAVYSSAVRTMTTLANSGNLTLDQATRFDRVRRSASQLLTQWRVSVIEGKPFDGLSSLNSILDELIRIQLESTTRE